MTRNSQTNLFKKQYQNFENVWNKDANDVEFVYARNLQNQLGYKKWRKFQKPIQKAKESCINNNYNDLYHFVHIDKMVALGSGSKRKTDDYKVVGVLFSQREM